MSGRLAVPLVLAAIVLGNLPGLGVGRVLNDVGLSQTWNVFAPEPATQAIDLSADVEFANGRHSTWRPPRRQALLAPLGYHWEMWAARVVSDDHANLWAPAARWIARHAAGSSRHVVRVTLRRRWVGLRVPGAGAARAGTAEFSFFTLDPRRRSAP